MNYHDSDFQQTFSNSDGKFNLSYEKGLDDGTLHGNSRFNTNSGIVFFINFSEFFFEIFFSNIFLEFFLNLF